MMGILFCNIGWMRKYEGREGKSDEIVGGGGKFAGKYAEVCNFVVGNDGYVYGHVETLQGGIDRKIGLEKIGGSGESVSGIDVIWTATHPKEGGRRVVGWYQNATVFRERQKFDRLPSEQHKLDEVKSYRIRARHEDVRRLEVKERTLRMGTGKGWMGHTPWWFARPRSEQRDEVTRFVDEVRTLLAGGAGTRLAGRRGNRRQGHSPSAPSDPYV
jgi:hypothetical protein